MVHKSNIGLFILITIFFMKSYQQSLLPDKDNESTTLKKLQIFFLEECECINLSKCQRMVDIISKIVIPIPSVIKDRIKKTSCGFNNTEPLICCPLVEENINAPESVEVASFRFGSSSSNLNGIDKINPDWVWPKDNEFPYFQHNHILGDHNDYKTSKNKKENNVDVRGKFPFSDGNGNVDDDKKYLMENLIDFEDKKTHKNCPPSFYDDRNTFYDNYKPFGKETDEYSGKYYRHPIPSHPPSYKNYHSFHNHYNHPYNPPHNYWYNHGHHHRFSPHEFPSNFPEFQPNKIPTIKPKPFTPHLSPILPITTSATEDSNNDSNNDANNSNTNNMNGIQFNSKQCGVSVGTRIIGGTSSTPGQFPWLARIAYRNLTSGTISYRCAGSFINQQYMVTAAHCVTNLIETLRISHVTLGDETDSDNKESEYQINQLLPHPGYDRPKYANDIALIKISQVTLQITPICLPAGEYRNVDNDLVGKIGTVAGWLSNIRGASRSNDLEMNFVRLPIVNQTNCAKIYSDFSINFRTPIIVSNSQICAQGTENMDACQGDSGGPLMMENIDRRNPKLVLLGLVSFGPRTCGISNFPGVYTRISAYTDWISKNMIL